MANNHTEIDRSSMTGNSVPLKTFKSTDNASVWTPHVNVDTVAAISLGALPAAAAGASSKVAYDGSAQSGALTATLVRVVSSTDCHLAFAANPTAVADGTGVFLPANAPEYFRVTTGNKIAAIKDAVAGNLFITVAAYMLSRPGKLMARALGAGLPRSGLVNRWDLFGGSGATVADAMTGLALTLTNSPTRGAGFAFATNQYGVTATLSTITMAGDWSIVLAALCDGSTDAVVSLASPASDSAYQTISYITTGTLQIHSRNGGDTGSTGLTVPSNAYLTLVLQSSGGTLTLTRLDTGAAVTLVNTNPVGAPRIGIACRARTSIGICNSLKALACLVYARVLTAAELGRIHSALQLTWIRRGVTLL